MSASVMLGIADRNMVRAFRSMLDELGQYDIAGVAGTAEGLLSTLNGFAATASSVDVAVIHEALGQVPVLDLIREVRARHPNVGVVLLVSPETGPDVLAAAIDAGARAIMSLPLSPENIDAPLSAAVEWAQSARRQRPDPAPVPSPEPPAYAAEPPTFSRPEPPAFSRPEPPAYAAEPPARSRDGMADPASPAIPHGQGAVVAVAGAKGGVGTTTLAVQLALQAASRGSAVYVVDLDLQGGDVGSLLNVRPHHSIVDIAHVPSRMFDQALDEATYRHESGVRLLLAPAAGEEGVEVGAREALRVVNGLRARCDVVVVDVGTTMTEANTAVIETADKVLLVVTPDVLALRASQRLIQMWERLEIRVKHRLSIVVNQVGRTRIGISPNLVPRIVGASRVRTTLPAAFPHLERVSNAGRLHELGDVPFARAVRQLAEELGICQPASKRKPDRRPAPDREPAGGERPETLSDSAVSPASRADLQPFLGG